MSPPTKRNKPQDEVFEKISEERANPKCLSFWSKKTTVPGPDVLFRFSCLCPYFNAKKKDDKRERQDWGEEGEERIIKANKRHAGLENNVNITYILRY